MSERTRLHYPTVYVVHTEDKNRYKSVPDYTVYVGETKVAAARDHVENGLTKAEVMAMHGIASVTPLERWRREYRAGGPGGARAEAQGQAQRLEIQTEARTDARAGARRTGRLSEGEGRVPGKTPGPAGVQVTRRERSAVRAPWR